MSPLLKRRRRRGSCLEYEQRGHDDRGKERQMAFARRHAMQRRTHDSLPFAKRFPLGRSGVCYRCQIPLASSGNLGEEVSWLMASSAGSSERAAPGRRSIAIPRGAERGRDPHCSASDLKIYLAASTYSFVQVFVRSIVLPCTFLLYVWSTLRMKSGAPAGIFPSGLYIGMLPVSAER